MSSNNETNHATKQWHVEGAVALVTGANRGIGAAFVQGLLAAGARRIYAGTRNPASLAELAGGDERVIPIQLDVTSDDWVNAAAQEARDVTILVNNAGVANPNLLIGATDITTARQEMEVNFFGTLRMSRAFAPVLAKNGGGVLINVLSILGRIASPRIGSYSASKAAAFSLTQSVRAELARQGTLVIGVMPGFVDTEMAARVTSPKISPELVVEVTLEALRNGQEDVYPGEQATQVAAQLLQNPKEVERTFAKQVAA